MSNEIQITKFKPSNAEEAEWFVKEMAEKGFSKRFKRVLIDNNRNKGNVDLTGDRDVAANYKSLESSFKYTRELIIRGEDYDPDYIVLNFLNFTFDKETNRVQFTLNLKFKSNGSF